MRKEYIVRLDEPSKYTWFLSHRGKSALGGIAHFEADDC
jgi:hypothetical protein